MSSQAPAIDEVQSVPAGWVAKALILAGGPAAALALTGIAAVLPEIEASLAHSDYDRLLVKLLIGLGGAAMVLGAPLTGFLADRIGLKRVLIGNYLLFTLAGTAGLYLDNLYGLIVARVLLGLAAAGAVTASIIIINSRLPLARRPTWFGAYVAVGGIAPLVFQPAVGLLGDQDWHMAFLVYVFGLPFFLLALLYKETPLVRVLKEKARAERLLSWFPIRFAVLGFIMGCVVYLPIIYSPFLLRDMGITTPSRIALVLVADAVTCTIMASLFGWSRKYISDLTSLAIAFTATAIGGFLVATAPNYLVVMAGMAVSGIGVGWFLPSLMTLLGRAVQPHQQGRAAGLVKAANYLATPLCVLLAEPAFRLFGPRIPLALVCVFSLVYLVLVLRHRGQAKAAAPAAAA